MNYPEWLPHGAICHMEGHDWLDGGVCVACGERLRCICGAFMRVDGFEAHEKKCRVLIAVAPQPHKEA